MAVKTLAKERRVFSIKPHDNRKKQSGKESGVPFPTRAREEIFLVHRIH
jgi:hypothetical protein